MTPKLPLPSGKRLTSLFEKVAKSQKNLDKALRDIKKNEGPVMKKIRKSHSQGFMPKPPKRKKK